MIDLIQSVFFLHVVLLSVELQKCHPLALIFFPLDDLEQWLRLSFSISPLYVLLLVLLQVQDLFYQLLSC